MPNWTRYHQEHDLIKENGRYYCKKCQVDWASKPRPKSCLGVPRYNIRKNRPSHLFTLRELEKKGKKPTGAPEGYVHMLNAPYWIFLYDISKTIPR